MHPYIERHKKELAAGGAGAAIVILLFLIACYTQRPVLTNPPTSTKESKVTLSGNAAPHVGVVLFDGKGNALLVVNANDKGEFTFSDVAIGEGATTFVLRAADSSFRFSFPTRLTVTRDTTAPQLEVNSLQGATVTGSNTVLTGKAEPNSTITVNGVQTAVGADGTWSATVALKPGANQVTIAATDAAGNTTTETQTIQYAPAAADSPTGTATVTTSTTAYSPGSEPPSSVTSTAPSAPAVSPSTSTAPASGSAAPAAPSPSPTGTTTPVPAPAPLVIQSITASAWVSNSSPNSRANETVYASIKDNYGRPVTNAQVQATVQFKSGSQTYSLTHQGNGQYAVSFKLNDKFISGFKVNVGMVARFEAFTATAYTSFTPD